MIAALIGYYLLISLFAGLVLAALIRRGMHDHMARREHPSRRYSTVAALNAREAEERAYEDREAGRG